jgi:hypothetical protein
LHPQGHSGAIGIRLELVGEHVERSVMVELPPRHRRLHRHHDAPIRHHLDVLDGAPAVVVPPAPLLGT